jgi:hypothetical protein
MGSIERLGRVEQAILAVEYVFIQTVDREPQQRRKGQIIN